jgi:hypothetical protein
MDCSSRPRQISFQIATTTFQLDPGQELFKCYHATFLNMSRCRDWESQMSKEAISFCTGPTLTRSGTDADAFGCTTPSVAGLITLPRPAHALAMPDGVATPLGSAQKV